MSVGSGSISAAHRECLSVRCVPNSEAQVELFSVSFGENRRSDSVCQGRESAHKRHSDLKVQRLLSALCCR
jgi:hypothetical protein